MEEGCHIVLRNVSVNMVGGYLRLSVSKWGKVSLHPDGVDSTPSSPSSIDEFESNFIGPCNLYLWLCLVPMICPILSMSWFRILMIKGEVE